MYINKINVENLIGTKTGDIMKLIDILKRFYYGKPKPKVVEDTIIESVEHPLLKVNDVEYRFPELYKPPKVTFKIRKTRSKQDK